MPKKDIPLAVIVGVLAGIIWSGIFVRLGTFARFVPNAAVFTLVIITPIGFVIALYLGAWLSRWKSSFYSFAKFVAVGFLNTGIDLGVFNLLIYLSNVQTGGKIALFKATSFTVALINSYFWNKYWAFDSGSTPHGGSEFVKYIVVTLIGAGLNVGVAYSLINFVPPAFGMSQLGWDSVAAMAATVVNMIWNFFGYRFLVFKHQSQPS